MSRVESVFKSRFKVARRSSLSYSDKGKNIFFSIGSYLLVLMLLIVNPQYNFNTSPSNQGMPLTPVTEREDDNPAGMLEVPDDSFNADINGNEEEAVVVPKNVNDYETVVRTIDKEELIDKAFFDNAAFIGDSLTEGLLIYGLIDNCPLIAAKGMTAEKAQKELGKFGGRGIQRVYLLLGVNDLTNYNQSIDSMLVSYRSLLQNLSQDLPDADVYVQSVFPLARKYNASKTRLTNEKIDEYNEGLLAICRELNIRFIDVAQSFSDEDGYMPGDYTSDGLHIKVSFYNSWMNILHENSIKKEI